MTASLHTLAERVEAASGADRALADEVLMACGWQLNHDADQIAEWKADPGVCEGEDGEDYPVTFEDRMTWACWYPPGNRPFRDAWIDGHYRPNPLASLDAAEKLVPEGVEGKPLSFKVERFYLGNGITKSRACVWDGLGRVSSLDTASDAATPALALVAAALRALAAQGEAGEGRG